MSNNKASEFFCARFWLIGESMCHTRLSLQELRGGASPDGVVKIVKLLKCRPLDWPACLKLARAKFEKYFNHRVRELLAAVMAS